MAKHLALASSGGHARARFLLGNALWDPVLSFDVTEEVEEEEEEEGGTHTATTTTTPPSLVVRAAGLGRDALELSSLRRSCPAALSLLRPVAEMTIAGLVNEARER